MSNAPQNYLLIDAIDLPRVNIDAMPLEALQGHEIKVLDTISALDEYVNSPPRKNADAKRNALMLSRKLSLHIASVRDLLQTHKLAAVMGGGVQAAVLSPYSVGAATAAPQNTLPNLFEHPLAQQVDGRMGGGGEPNPISAEGAHRDNSGGIGAARGETPTNGAIPKARAKVSRR